MDIETISGYLEIDRTHNRVTFIPHAVVEYEVIEYDYDGRFQLPLAPLDIDIAKQLSNYAKAKAK